MKNIQKLVLFIDELFSTRNIDFLYEDGFIQFINNIDSKNYYNLILKKSDYNRVVGLFKPEAIENLDENGFELVLFELNLKISFVFSVDLLKDAKVHNFHGHKLFFVNKNLDDSIIELINNK